MDAEISPEQHRLQTCKITGDLRVGQYDGEDGRVMTLYGDPEGLRSLATILNDLAALYQQAVPLCNLPIGEGFHLHLGTRGLSVDSMLIDIGRSDPRMNISLKEEEESALRERVTEQLLREAQRDVEALYRFIDPAIRESRNAKHDFEPELTIRQIGEYTSRIDSAELVSFAIDGYTNDSGDDRGNVPTAIVLSTVCYNHCDRLKEYRTPWVRRDGQWYTCAIGKIVFPPINSDVK